MYLLFCLLAYLTSAELEVEGASSGPGLVEDLPIFVVQPAHVMDLELVPGLGLSLARLGLLHRLHDQLRLLGQRHREEGKEENEAAQLHFLPIVLSSFLKSVKWAAVTCRCQNITDAFNFKVNSAFRIRRSPRIISRTANILVGAVYSSSINSQ